MAKKLNPDGLPEDVPSVLPDKKSDLFRDLNLGHEEDKESLNLPEEPPTRIASGGEFAQNTPSDFPSSTSEPLTKVIIRPRKSVKKEDSPSPTLTSLDIVPDPVIGWVVIIDGPGKGTGLQLGAGQNTLARGKRARVRIDFGDHEISRESHTIITYDPKHNRYYIQPGMGTNLTYLENEPVLSPTPLTSGSRIVLGSTTLRFIALCDETFTWSE